jgi:hypothetical protein
LVSYNDRETVFGHQSIVIGNLVIILSTGYCQLSTCEVDANKNHMEQLLRVLIFVLSVCSITAFGQTPLEKYIEAKEKSNVNHDIETSLVTAEEISVSTERPLIIKSPSEGELFKVYVFTKIFETTNYKVFIGLSDDPFKPNLVTSDKAQTQIDKLQLLGSYGPSRPEFEPMEEVKIISDQQIILSAKLSTWALDSRGQRIDNSKKVENKSNKYKITESGKIEEIVESSASH